MILSHLTFMAHRLYRHSGDARHVSKPAILIATLGIAVGLAVMLVSLSVVMGFKSEIKNKVIGFGSHIQVVNYDAQYRGVTLPVCVNDSLIHTIQGIPGVGHVQRFARKTGMLKTDEAFRGIILEGVEPEYDLTFIRQHLVAGQAPAFKPNGGDIVLSRQIANELKLKVGDRPYAYFFEDGIRARRFTVVGIYCTNMSEFDNQLVLTDARTIQQLNRWEADQYSGAAITLSDFERLDEVSHQLVRHVNRTQDRYGAYYTSPTILELFPSIFSWLDLLDLNVIIILVLMTCVAGVTMISGLLIIILERTNFIGVMKAMGARNGHLIYLFLNFAGMIILRGILLGNVLGMSLIALQHYLHIIHLDPETYYVDSVPMGFPWVGFALVNVATLLISLAALILPSLIVLSIHPARSIRFE